MAPLVNRKFRIVPTGGKFDIEGLEYLSSFQLGGELVFHVFEVMK